MEYSRTSPQQELSGSGPEEYIRFPDHRVPKDYGDPTAEYAALKKGAAVFDRSYKTILRLTGKDPIGLLDAVLTNRMPKENRLGVYAALLNQKGRIQTDLRVLKDADGDLIVDTEPEGSVAAKEILGRYAPFSRVKVEDLGEAEPPWEILGLYGPRAGDLLGGLSLTEHETMEVEIGSGTPLVVGVTLPVSGYDLIGPSDELRAVREHLVTGGAAPVGLDAYETARIEAGIPRFGPDMTPDNFPGEAGILERAVDFAKGCYPGQETVARMHYRGHPNRELHRFVIDGPEGPPSPGAQILQGEKKVGWISSVAPMPVDGKTFALGYLSRKADPDTPLWIGGSRIQPLTV